MGTDGGRMGTATHAAPYRCPRAVPCMAGASPMFPQIGPSIWESKFAAVGHCGWRGDTSRSTRFLHSKKKSAKLLLLGISPGISLLLFVGEVASLGPGLRGPGPCLALLWPANIRFETVATPRWAAAGPALRLRRREMLPVCRGFARERGGEW